MRPIDAARRVYDREPCRRTFDDDLQLHLANGFVYSDSDLFLLARPVKKGAPSILVVDPAITFGSPDCWLVFLAAGNISRCFHIIPYYLPWVAWEIENKLRYHNTRRALLLCLRKANLLRGQLVATRMAEEPQNLQSLHYHQVPQRPLTIARLRSAKAELEQLSTTTPPSWGPGARPILSEAPYLSRDRFFSPSWVDKEQLYDYRQG